MRVSLAGVVQVVAPLDDHLLDAEATLQVLVQELRHRVLVGRVRVLCDRSSVVMCTEYMTPIKLWTQLIVS